MMLSAQTIRKLRLLDPCLDAYRDPVGNSAGLSACGYDLTLSDAVLVRPGEFVLASANEWFNLPAHVAAIIHDKSSLARKGLVVQNTCAEPGWRGWLTLELTNHSTQAIRLPSGAAICQAIFHFLDEPTDRPYAGKYQDQGRMPQPAIMKEE